MFYLSLYCIKPLNASQTEFSTYIAKIIVYVINGGVLLILFVNFLVILINIIVVKNIVGKMINVIA